MTDIKRSFIYGAIGGLSLYVIDFIHLLLSCYQISDPLFFTNFFLSIVLGAGMVITLSLYRRPRFIHCLLRSILSYITYACILTVNGCIGTTRFLFSAFGIVSSSAHENVLGMLTLSFLVGTVLLSFTGLFISFFIRKTLYKYNG